MIKTIRYTIKTNLSSMEGGALYWIKFEDGSTRFIYEETLSNQIKGYDGNPQFLIGKELNIDRQVYALGFPLL